MPVPLRWTETELRHAVERSATISATLRLLGLSTSPGNFKTFYRYVEQYGIDTAHFLGRRYLAGRRHKSGRGRHLDEILVENSTYASGPNLRKRLIAVGLLEEICAACGQEPVWCGKPLTLQLDHANGNPRDNRLENLRLLCPNCHTQTPTFTGKGRYVQAQPRCVICSAKITRASTMCRACAAVASNPNKADWPSIDVLEAHVKQHGCAATGRMLGVSDNSVRRRIMTHRALMARIAGGSSTT